MFKTVNNKVSFPELENSITTFWKHNRIFEKSVENRSADNSYVFYDGPPFITGTPHYGTLLPSIAKDVIPRYQTMKGKRVERVWGWDCHGLPIENKVEKELNIKNRRDIEQYGIQRFVDACYSYTRNTSAEWKWYVDKIGRWVDLENSYKTMDQDYIETVLWVFKQLYDKGKIYEGVRTSLFCTRCGTPVSNFEIAMDNSYADMEDPAVTIKFPVLTEGKFKGSSILAWTTTPWTLPSNKALVLDDKEDYVIAEVQKLDIELEKVWEVTELPKDLNKYKRSNITQAYLKEYQDDSGLEVKKARIRKQDDKYTFTVKYWAGSHVETGQMIEKTEEISKEKYIELIKTAENKVVKIRHYLPLEGGLTAELDIYQNNLNGLNVVEVEFPSLSKEQNFKKPEWFGKELTDSAGVYPPEIAGLTLDEVNKINAEYSQKPHNYQEHAINEKVILAKKRLAVVLKDMDYKILDTVKGKELVGLKYEPPFNFFEATEKEHQVYSYEGMVTMEEGTGIVHSAPGFGDIDTEMGRHYGLGMAMSIDDEGRYIEQVKDYHGQYVKEADNQIMADLKKKGPLFKQEKIVHRYPYCWRCATPLLQKAQPSWFMDIQGMKQNLVANNENINWVPAHLKQGRFKKGIEMAPDWGISRTRYWASPMPIWQRVEKGKVVERVVLGSRDEIRAMATVPITRVDFKIAADTTALRLGGESLVKEIEAQVKTVLQTNSCDFLYEVTDEALNKAFSDIIPALNNELEQLLSGHKGEHLTVVTTAEIINLVRHIAEGKSLKEVFGLKIANEKIVAMYFNGIELLDLHRPKIDGIELKGKTGTLKRVDEVLDVWMDSASMPYASRHYPFENKEALDANFPADFVIEYIAQTRAWFYVMHVLGTALFDKNPFKNVLTTGVIFGTDGRKMSKSYGNYPDPKIILEKYGAEPLRLYLMGAPVMVGEDISLDEDGLRVQVRDFLLPLWNSYSFFVTYANINEWQPTAEYEAKAKSSTSALDRWIIQRLNETTERVTAEFDKYDLPAVVKHYFAFLDDLSKWYIRRSRERFAAKEYAAYDTLYFVLVEFSKMIAPIAPFISEEIYRNLVATQITDSPESIHLADFPAFDTAFAKTNAALTAEMSVVREVVALAQGIRAQNGLKVRQPLSALQVSLSDKKISVEAWMQEVINEEMNVKQTDFVTKAPKAGADWLEAENDLHTITVRLNSKITPELKAEGLLREFTRAVQDLRKKSGMAYGEEVELELEIKDAELKEAVLSHNKELLHDLFAKTISLADNIVGASEVKVNDSVIKVLFKK